jgi:TonB family protein
MITLISLLMAAAPQSAGAGPTRAQPLEPMANWFADRDYPADAMRRQAEGNVRFRVVIDQRGNVESCTILQSSNDPALDAATCSIMSIRGRFEPARDRHGQAVKDSVESRVRWVLPDDMPPPLPFEPIRFVSTLHATAEGEVSCSTNSGGNPDDSISSDCGTFGGSGIAAMMRALRVDTVLTSILTIVPQGAEPPAAGAADYGTSLYEAEAALSVAPTAGSPAAGWTDTRPLGRSLRIWLGRTFAAFIRWEDSRCSKRRASPAGRASSVSPCRSICGEACPALPARSPACRNGRAA